jgi:hypothetical protein
MPTSISNLLDTVGLKVDGQIEWGKECHFSKCGIYIIAITDEADSLVFRDDPPFSKAKIEEWIHHNQNAGKPLLIDKAIADTEKIIARLKGFWIPDETILYIGKAGPSKTRTIKNKIKRILHYKIRMRQTTQRWSLDSYNFRPPSLNCFLFRIYK